MGELLSLFPNTFARRPTTEYLSPQTEESDRISQLQEISRDSDLEVGQKSLTPWLYVHPTFKVDVYPAGQFSPGSFSARVLDWLSFYTMEREGLDQWNLPISRLLFPSAGEGGGRLQHIRTTAFTATLMTLQLARRSPEAFSRFTNKYVQARRENFSGSQEEVIWLAKLAGFLALLHDFTPRWGDPVMRARGLDEAAMFEYVINHDQGDFEQACAELRLKPEIVRGWVLSMINRQATTPDDLLARIVHGNKALPDADIITYLSGDLFRLKGSIPLTITMSQGTFEPVGWLTRDQSRFPADNLEVNLLLMEKLLMLRRLGERNSRRFTGVVTEFKGHGAAQVRLKDFDITKDAYLNNGGEIVFPSTQAVIAFLNLNAIMHRQVFSAIEMRWLEDQIEKVLGSEVGLQKYPDSMFKTNSPAVAFKRAEGRHPGPLYYWLYDEEALSGIERETQFDSRNHAVENLRSQFPTNKGYAVIPARPKVSLRTEAMVRVGDQEGPASELLADQIEDVLAEQDRARLYHTVIRDTLAGQRKLFSDETYSWE